MLGKISDYRKWISSLGESGDVSMRLNFYYEVGDDYYLYFFRLSYLVNAYADGDAKKLYPKDNEKRAMVDMYMQFDLATLYQRTVDYYFPSILLGAHLDESKKARLAEGLKFFEAMLSKDRKFATSNDFTIADLCLCVTTSQIEIFGFDMLPYPKIRKWLKECKIELESYGYEVNY